MVSFWPSFNRITGGDTDGCIACYLPLKDEDPAWSSAGVKTEGTN